MQVKKDVTIDELIQRAESYCSDSNLNMIKGSFSFAKQAHQGQTRMTGKPYIKHPLAVAYIIADIGLEPPMICAALMHDVIEDTDRTYGDIKQEFTEEIADLVRGDTKIGELKYKGVERYVENWRRLFLSMAEDVRTMIIKLADRVHNIQTVEVHPEDKIYKRCLESLEIYAPIAGRLGMIKFKEEIENKAFPHVHPEEYKKIKNLAENKLDQKENFFETTIKKIKERLKGEPLDINEIRIKKKGLYEIYKENKKQDRDLKLYDLIAIIVVVSSPQVCYDTLGYLHSFYKPVRDRIKDYISQPKPNGYQSLHTTVFNDGNLVEFQIRTNKMDLEAKHGAATYWSEENFTDSPPEAEITWAKAFSKVQNEINGLQDLEEVKVDYLKSKVFVFTPDGKVINLPEGSTPIDFAYQISPELGNNCKAARVNNKLTELSSPLKNGDVVKIITEKDHCPKQKWLEFVKTSKAKKKIKTALKENDSAWLGPNFFD